MKNDKKGQVQNCRNAFLKYLHHTQQAQHPAIPNLNTAFQLFRSRCTFRFYEVNSNSAVFDFKTVF